MLHLSQEASPLSGIVRLRAVEEISDRFLSRLEATKYVLRQSESLIGC